MIDQYQISKVKRSGVRSDPNRADAPEYIVRRVGLQVVQRWVLTDTVEIVEDAAEALYNLCVINTAARSGESWAVGPKLRKLHNRQPGPLPMEHSMTVRADQSEIFHSGLVILRVA